MKQTNTQKILRRSGIPVVCRNCGCILLPYSHVMCGTCGSYFCSDCAKNIGALKKKKKDLKILLLFFYKIIPKCLNSLSAVILVKSAWQLLSSSRYSSSTLVGYSLPRFASSFKK